MWHHTTNLRLSLDLRTQSFESYSEDPHLSGHIAASYIANVQKNGIGACIKHFVYVSFLYFVILTELGIAGTTWRTIDLRMIVS